MTIKGPDYWYTQQHEWIWRASCEVKEAKQKATYCTILFMWHFGKGKTIGTETKLVIARGRGRELTSKELNMPERELLGVLEMFHIKSVEVIN